MTYVKPWTRQEKLRREYNQDEVPDLDEISNMIGNIKFGKARPKFQTMQARALFALYYLTACRKSELVITTKLRKQKIRRKEIMTKHGKTKIYELDENGKIIVDRSVEEHEYWGVKKNDIKFDYIDDRKVMYIRTENRKNKSRTTKRQPIPIEFEKEIVRYVYDYIKLLQDDSILFEFSDKRATQIINETTGFNVHFIRHIRLTHLITLYDFNEQALIRFAGWTDARPAKHYMELQSKDIFRQFYKNRGD